MKSLFLFLSIFLITSCNSIPWDKIPPIEETDPTPTPIPRPNDLPENITWTHADISGWKITSKLEASISGNRLILNYDKADVWPIGDTRATDGGPLVGNPWVVCKQNGKWVAATFEWMRPGQKWKPKHTVEGGHTKVRQIPNDWKPKTGETMYIIVSTFARGAERTINERSNAVKIVWK